MVQLLKLHIPNAGGTGLIIGWVTGTKILNAAWPKRLVESSSFIFMQI